MVVIPFSPLVSPFRLSLLLHKCKRCKLGIDISKSFWNDVLLRCVVLFSEGDVVEPVVVSE